MTRRRAGSKPDSIGNGKHSPENYIALKVSSVQREDPHRPERNWGLNPQKTCVPTETDTGTHYLTEGVIKHTNSNWSKLAPSAEDHLEGEGWTCLFLACRAPSQECYKGAAATFQWVMVFQHIRDRLFQNRSRRAVIEKQKGEGKKKKNHHLDHFKTLQSSQKVENFCRVSIVCEQSRMPFIIGKCSCAFLYPGIGVMPDCLTIKVILEA